jgi:hypothetical protein
LLFLFVPNGLSFLDLELKPLQVFSHFSSLKMFQFSPIVPDDLSGDFSSYLYSLGLAIEFLLRFEGLLGQFLLPLLQNLSPEFFLFLLFLPHKEETLAAIRTTAGITCDRSLRTLRSL